MTRWLFALVFCAGAIPAFAQLSPEQTVKSMTVADGLQVELFAAEPMLVNPTSIDVDHRGRVWVCEAVNYRRKAFGRPILREEGDRIVILEDTTGSGKADKSTVFYQGKDLIAPIGICVAAYPNPEKKGAFSYKVFVCQSPDILLFEDKDGDGKADGPPKKFLTGFRGFDHDHGVHGINIGPDGKLYFTVGDQGVDGLQSSDGKGRKWKSNDTDCRAGTVWRCDMDGTNLELIAHNFRNNYECCVNSFGEVWLSDNDDDGSQQTRICYVMPGGNYGYYPRGKGESHWHEEQPGIVHKVLRTGFGSPTGICFYEGSLLPEKYRGQLLHTDAGPREFRALHIKPKGAGYELEKENLVTSTDTWFRLSDVCVAPDGSVMLADWYDPGVGGHGMGDWTRGRIYRVTPKGHKGYDVPKFDLSTKEGVGEALVSPNLATRALLSAHLHQLGAQKGAAEIHAHFEPRIGIKRNPLVVARGLWQYAGLIRNGIAYEASENPHDDLQLACMDIRLREELLRMRRDDQPRQDGLKSWARSTAPTAIQQILDSPVPIRREALLALRNEDAPHAKELIMSFAKLYDDQDHFYRAALNIACGTDPMRREAILADFDKQFPEWNDKIADLVWELRPASSLPRLAKLLKDPKLTAAQKGRIVDILAVYDTADAGRTMLAVLNSDAAPEVKARAIDSLKLYLPTRWKGLQGGKELNAAIDNLLKNKGTQIVGLQLVAAVGSTNCVEAVIHIADGNGGALDGLDPIQDEAVRTLGKLKTAASVNYLTREANTATVNPKPIPRVQAAITGLAMMITGQPKDDIGAKALAALQLLVTKRYDMPSRQQLAVEVLAGTRPGTVWLLDQHEKGKLQKDLVADAGRLLRNSPFPDLRNRANLAFPAAGKLDPKKLPSPAVLAKRTGNATRGAAIFQASAKNDAQCQRCHSVRGVGGNIGPDLSMIGKKASKENLFESILIPSKAIADQYLQWKINTLDGKSVTGLLVSENDKEITLRDANGKDHTFAQKDLDGAKQKSLVSIMPDNLVAAMTEDELIDLVEYLLTLKTPALTPDSWYVIGPFKRGGDNPLGHDFGPDKAAFDPKATFPEWNGPQSGPKAKDLSWRTIRPDAKGYIDLMALHGDAGVNSVSYLHRAIESPVEQSAEFLIGSDDGCVLFVNGKEVLRENVTRAAAPDQNRVKATLKAGKNEVLMKIANGNNPHGAYVTIVSEQELKLK
jgi:putative membrane-bound dehydrogenase-like protein